MSVFEDSYKSQLQGVSQQVPRERLDGQLTAQDNMLSDTVTNLRRRPGAAFAFSLSIANATVDSILTWDTDINSKKCTVLLNTVDGVLRVLDSTLYTLLATLPASAYLTTTNVGDIQVATVGDAFYLANTAKAPALVPTSALNPLSRGMFYIKAGAFSKTYELKVQTNLGAVTASYTTPTGTTAGDAALSTPEYICIQLVDQITSTAGTHGVAMSRDASFAYGFGTSGATTVTFSTPSGVNFMIASGQAYIRQESDLPSRLPAAADGFIISTGELKSLRYYEYDSVKLAWLETGDYISPAGITNMPVALTYAPGTTTFALDATAYEGRFAGDDESNPNPDFISRGITGIGSYQGRLVVLAGSLVNMSASNKPKRFYRSTVTSLLDSDCISIGSSAASSAAYRYAIPFQKDLLLFSEKYQALVPGSNIAVTPRTAAVLVTSTYDSDMTSRPTPVGRTLMYAAPRSKDFFGLMEMLPSTQTESQYTSFDSTAHLPKYMAGKCRFSVSSSVANMVLFAPTGDRNSLIVHEYTWAEDKKIQQAWHKWTFKYPVACAYFSGQTVHILFVKNGMVVGCTVDPRLGTVTAEAERRPFLDMSVFIDVVDNEVMYPAWIGTFDPAALPDLKLSVAEGPLAGEPVGFTAVGSTMTTVLSFPDGKVSCGFPYRSALSPTPPMVKDANGVKISSNKLTVQRFMIGTENSQQYDVTVSDAATLPEDVGEEEVGTLYFSSPELVLGNARVGDTSIAIVPCRTAADSTSLVISTDGVGELNIVSLEYVAKFNQKIKRAKVYS